MNDLAAGNPLRRLGAFGQSVWLDYIQRSLLTDGTLSRLIHEDGLSGMTSNPAIFEKAISRDRQYRDDIPDLAAQGLTPTEMYEMLTFEDICCAADVLRPIYESTGGHDGYVSIEISPHLADDTEATVAEAIRIWDQINRANLMIKVPATAAGIPALRRLCGLGVNVNATLLFSVERYHAIADAYLSGLEDYIASGLPPGRLASVASFFLSRIDTLVDQRLDAIGTRQAQALRGMAAVSCARLAYRVFEEQIANPRWQTLAQAGARPQRLLWASTSTKDPAYADLKYVEPLVAPDTVNTLPPETLAAYRDHGQPAIRIHEEFAQARHLPEQLAHLGIDLAQVADQLERDGVRKFIEPYDRVLRELGQFNPTP